MTTVTNNHRVRRYHKRHANRFKIIDKHLKGYELMHIDIYTDGSCEPNPGIGGWAAILKANGNTKEISGRLELATNNTAELTAVIEALTALKGGPHDVTLWTDSRYTQLAVDGMRSPKANIELLKQVKYLVSQHRVKVEWIRGHTGHAENERCDYLASVARQGVTA